MKKSILLFCLLLSSAFFVQANESAKVGFFAGYNSNIMHTDFPSLDGVLNCCPAFANDNGLGYNFGMLFQYPIGKSITFGLRSTISNWNSQLSAIEQDDLLHNGSIVRGDYENKIDLNLTVFSLEPNFGINLIDQLYLHLGLGMNFTSSHRFEKSEIVLDPSDAIFPNNEPNNEVRNEIAGSFDNVPSILLSANLGFYYDAPLNKDETIFISPGVFYNIGMTNFIDKVEWKMDQLQVSIALKFAFGKSNKKAYKTVKRDVFDTVNIVNPTSKLNEVRLGKSELIETEYEENNEVTLHIINRRTDTLIVGKNFKLTGDISVVGVDANGNTLAKPQFLSEQFIDNRNQPLLNYIFFDSLSFDIPERYNKINIADAQTFKIESLFKKSNIETYYNILNILGYRLSKFNTSKITIKGCNSHIGAERWNQILSRNRANSIANYLSSVWGIDKSRIEIIAQNLPDSYSFPSNQIEKAQENRRVEIYSDHYELLAPIFVNDTSVVNQPAKAKFIINSSSEAGMKNWSVNITNNTEAGSRNMVKGGEGNPPAEIEINLDQIIDNNFNPESRLSYSLDLFDKLDGKLIGKEKTFEIEKLSIEKKRKEKIGDMEIERFSLILFDFISDLLNYQNTQTIERVKSRMTPNSNIRIIGYTDQSGEAKDNKILSLKRAESAYKALGRKDAIVEGKGEEIELYDNSQPEGRFYSRTVEIIVETPVY